MLSSVGRAGRQGCFLPCSQAGSRWPACLPADMRCPLSLAARPPRLVTPKPPNPETPLTPLIPTGPQRDERQVPVCGATVHRGECERRAHGGGRYHPTGGWRCVCLNRRRRRRQKPQQQQSLLSGPCRLPGAGLGCTVWQPRCACFAAQPPTCQGLGSRAPRCLPPAGRHSFDARRSSGGQEGRQDDGGAGGRYRRCMRPPSNTPSPSLHPKEPLLCCLG